MATTKLQIYTDRSDGPVINAADRIDAPIKINWITIINATGDAIGLQLGYEMQAAKALDAFNASLSPVFKVKGAPDIIPIPPGLHNIQLSTVCELPAVVMSAACYPLIDGQTIDMAIIIDYDPLPPLG